MYDNRDRPPGLTARILEFAVIVAVSGWLIRLGICYIEQVLPTLAVIAALVVAAVIGWRIWKHRHDTKW